MFSLGIGSLIVKVAVGIGGLVALLFGIKSFGAKREREGEAKMAAKVAANNVRVQQAMAKVEKPTESEALKRLRDGTA